MEKSKEYYEGLDKRTTEYKEWKRKFEEAQESQSEGLGDTVEKIAKVTGIKAAVKFIAGDDCGCDDRKEKLNKIFPYNKPECLEEKEYETLHQFFKRPKNSITPKEQLQLIAIYNRVLHYNFEPTSCAPCFKEVISRLEKLYKTYL